MFKNKKLLKIISLSQILFLISFIFTPYVDAPVLAQTSPLSRIRHIFIILMENHDWSAITPSAAPYINGTLLSIGAHANNYHNVPTSLGSLHPSEPNYVFLEGGTNRFSDITFTTDNVASGTNSTSSTAHLATQLNNKGLSWRSYQENMPSGTCPITNSGQYAAKHNPFVFFKDVSGNPPSSTNSYCIAHHEVLTAANLQNDLNSGNVANYNFLTPNLCNDMHDCSVTTGDNWLKTFIPIILNSNVYKTDGAVFITWDEGGSGNNPIGMVMLSPFIKAGFSNSIEYSHASFVKTVENTFGLTPYVGHAADSGVSDLSAFFNLTSTTPTAGGSTPTVRLTMTVTPTPRVSNTPTPTGTLAGDVNGDGVVDIIDFQLLSNSFGKTSGQSGYNAKADFNHDNVVDILDFQILSNNFGRHL